jgi:MFS family permease
MNSLLKGKNDPSTRAALIVIILFGLVSLFGDIIYEGARSVNGPYLKTLGASAVAVGFIAGLGEFLGYSIRLVSGYFSDKTRAYWYFTIAGYGMLIFVPLLALTGIWQIAGVFIVLERFGKALRSPAKDTIMSMAAKRVGTGFGFGLHEAMDQTGAIIGPLIFTGLFVLMGGGSRTAGDYQIGYAILFIPFLIVLGAVVFAYRKIPNPEEFEDASKAKNIPDKLDRVFWSYMVFSFVATMGFVNFALIGFHLKNEGVVPDWTIPLLYAVAMGVDGAFALVIGKVYDRLKEKNNNERAGLMTLIVIPLFSVLVPLSFLTGSVIFPIIGIVFWGMVMGAQETIMKSSIADITPLRKRGTGYGLLNTATGLAFLVGGIAFGALYEVDPILIFAAVIAIQLMAIPAFLVLNHHARK